MLIGAPGWEGGDPSMMSSESTVDTEAGCQSSSLTWSRNNGKQTQTPGYLRWSRSSAPRCRPSPAEDRRHRHVTCYGDIRDSAALFILAAAGVLSFRFFLSYVDHLNRTKSEEFSKRLSNVSVHTLTDTMLMLTEHIFTVVYIQLQCEYKQYFIITAVVDSSSSYPDKRNKLLTGVVFTAVEEESNI